MRHDELRRASAPPRGRANEFRGPRQRILFISLRSTRKSVAEKGKVATSGRGLTVDEDVLPPDVVLAPSVVFLIVVQRGQRGQRRRRRGRQQLGGRRRRAQRLDRLRVVILHVEALHGALLHLYTHRRAESGARRDCAKRRAYTMAGDTRQAALETRPPSAAVHLSGASNPTAPPRARRPRSLLVASAHTSAPSAVRLSRIPVHTTTVPFLIAVT
ncbi:hypothetical protein EVAR_69462_1 [Eumeta japonica]|uniref:Uncharacterized protein n=1 Tax=Eumeta variegata TaxID=151549 RepID=A0A4C1SBD3_EUMVA|nr:hypothetical protein EVAR_69462_1 [Eumeta japonica]